MSTSAVKSGRAHILSMMREVARLSSGLERFSREFHQLKEEVRMSIEEYAKSECLTLCSMMQEKLSRELRDMVYEALLGEPENYYVDNEEFGSGHYYSAEIVVNNGHIGDETFVGEETLTELAEMWYRHSVFKLQGDSDVACLFRNKTWVDLPDLDTTRWIRHVCMDVIPRDFMGGGLEKTLEAGEELVLPSDFEQLAKLEHPATFTIGIYFSHWYYHGETRKGKKVSVDLLSRRVFPVLKQLIASGVGVALQIYETEPVKVGLEHLDSEGWSKLVRGVHLRQ